MENSNHRDARFLPSMAITIKGIAPDFDSIERLLPGALTIISMLPIITA